MNTHLDLIKQAIEAYERDDGDTWQVVSDAWEKVKAAHPLIDFSQSIGDGVGPGWWLPLENTFNEVAATLISTPGYRFKVKQIKEKFGGLRFYFNLVPVNYVAGEVFWEDPTWQDLQEKMSLIVERCEEVCAATCEVCGEPGRLRPRSWVKTLCDAHAGDPGDEGWDDDPV